MVLKMMIFLISMTSLIEIYIYNLKNNIEKVLYTQLEKDLKFVPIPFPPFPLMKVKKLRLRIG